MTREEDLLRIAKKLDKMVSRNNMDGALDLLRELKDFNMTLKLLQDTRIGMSVNGIRKHCTDEDVVNLAKMLIKNWKKLLESAQNQKSERLNEVKNGKHPSKTSGSPSRTSPERESRKDAPVDFFPPVSVNSHPLRRSSIDAKKERKDTQGSLQSPPLQAHPHKRLFIDGKKERRDAPYPLFPLHHHPHPPLPPPPIPIPKLTSDMKKERKVPSETLPPPPPLLSSPPPKRLSKEEPKERAKKAPDPNAPLPPIPFHLHPPQKREMKKERKETAEPGAPLHLPPAPLHLQPPTPTKRPALDTKKDKEKERKDTSDPKRQTSEHNEKDRKDTRDSKPLKRPSMKIKIERKDSTESKKLHSRKLSLDGRRDSKDSTDSKSSHHILKRQSSELKLERRDSTNSRSGSSPQGKKSSERQELKLQKHHLDVTSSISYGFIIFQGVLCQ
ncbi:phosphatase and actin regulator 4B-like isoform X4 [Carassius carassius]|uniref:phosphatase and actin regulator 4B-like isoform X4 n=1 Tax=Carassius carassius TaxID=217509 RepID=UPI0028690168|nr:phosphatase and actin regulator 4B-like isoform X4 [Carassius carassius]